MIEHTWQTFYKKYGGNDDTAKEYEAAFTRFCQQNQKQPNMVSAIRPDEMMAFGVLLNYYQPRLIIETGTNYGVSATMFALALPEARIITFDVPHLHGSYAHSMVDNNTWGTCFRETELEERIRAEAVNTYDLNPLAYPPADLWFLDSGHDYRIVAHETRLAIENMGKRGVIFYHDARPGLPWGSDVHQYLTERCPGANYLETATGVAWVEVGGGC